MTKSRDSRVESQAFGEDVLDLIGRDGDEVAVVSSLSDNDDRLPLPLVPMLSPDPSNQYNEDERRE